VAAIRRKLREFFDWRDERGRAPCNARWGVYAFFDYDGEPIYVGQTCERLRQRISRHLTNQRTDAVAMFVLDPFEVESVEVWPLWQFERVPCAGAERSAEARAALDGLERAVYDRLVAVSKFHAILNEKGPPDVTPMAPPPSFKASIIPEELRELRSHPDVRIARRASTIANLARVIAERGEVNPGLRHTLVVQARRLEWLASRRVEELGAPRPAKRAGTGTEEEVQDGTEGEDG
jgi:hypothetical protein